MQLGEEKEVKNYPKRIRRKDAIPAPDIFAPKKTPVENPIEAPIPVELPHVPIQQP
jgi:hypothetical protein